jgi:hypothetical protein
MDPRNSIYKPGDGLPGIRAMLVLPEKRETAQVQDGVDCVSYFTP